MSIDREPPKLIPFYRKLNKLGEALANQQKQIITWMLQTRCQANTELLATFKNSQLYPVLPCSYRSDFRGMPFYRPNDDFNQEINGVEDCRTQTFTNHDQFQNTAGRLFSGEYESAPTFKIKYSSQQGTVHFEKPKFAKAAKELPFSMQRRVRSHYENFIFREATVTSCTRFTNYFGRLSEGLPFIFEIPNPLVFKPEFFTRDNKLILLASDRIDSPFEKIRTPTQLGDLGNKVWGLTETTILGSDFQSMEFKPEITAVTLQNEVWRTAMSKNPLGGWPNLWSHQDDIHH